MGFQLIMVTKTKQLCRGFSIFQCCCSSVFDIWQTDNPTIWQAGNRRCQNPSVGEHWTRTGLSNPHRSRIEIKIESKSPARNLRYQKASCQIIKQVKSIVQGAQEPREFLSFQFKTLANDRGIILYNISGLGVWITRGSWQLREKCVLLVDGSVTLMI